MYVEEMRTSTAKATINKLKKIFSIEGSPEILISDNAVFNHAAFQKFSQEWNFEHITSSPNYPQSNGQAEQDVQTMKQRMARHKKGGSDWQQALQELRFTPTKDLPSPSEILHGRPARTMNGQATATAIKMQEIKQKLEVKQEQYADHYNKRHKVIELQPLHMQKLVVIQHRDGNWEPATITQIGPEPRSYLCTTNGGKVFRRNRRHIHITGLSDQKDDKKTCLKTTTTTAAKKSVRWSDDVHITVDAETAYSLATQGMQFFTEIPVSNPTPPLAVVTPVLPAPPPSVPVVSATVPIAAEPETAEAEPLHAETDEEDNQSHLSDSDRREGNAEGLLLTPDEQVTSVGSQTLETCPECSPPMVTRLCCDFSRYQLVKK